MLLIAVTIAKPVVDDAALRNQYAANPQILQLALAKMARKVVEHVREKDQSWIPGEVVLVAEPDSDRPVVVLQRSLDVAGSLRSLPNTIIAATNQVEALGALLHAYETEEGLPVDRAALPLDERLNALVEHYIELLPSDVPAVQQHRQTEPEPEEPRDDLAAVDSDILARELRLTRQHLVDLYGVVTTIVEEGTYNLSDDQSKVIEMSQEHLMGSAANDPLFVLADQAEAAWKAGEVEGAMNVGFPEALEKLLAEVRKGRPRPEEGQILIPVSRRSYERLKFAAGATGIAKSVEALLDTTTQRKTVPTYHADGRGHAEPLVPVQVSVGQGVTVTLGENDDVGPPDVYVERHPEMWQVNLTPDGSDVRLVAKVHDNGKLVVTDAHGTTLLDEDPVPESPEPERNERSESPEA